jgi:hypothetical protein
MYRRKRAPARRERQAAGSQKEALSLAEKRGFDP